jgi:hypothetical protein
MRVVTFFAPELCDAVETMAYFLATEEAACHVRLATKLEGGERTEHPWVLGRISQFGGIEIAPYDEMPKYSDVLVFYLVRHGRISNKFDPWRARAKSAVYLLASEGPVSWPDWLRETVRSFPHYLRARKITFRPYIHPGLIANSEWFKASLGPIDIDDRRRWRLGFLGNRQPPERIARLAQCKDAFVGAENRVNWHEYEHNYGGLELNRRARFEPIEPMDYMRALSDMDFCVSPPGWGQQWTHRTIEALVRGAIPIIEDPQVYGLGLRDAENCIVARPDDWGAAVRRALDVSEAETRRMRRNVVALREEQLLPKRAIDHFRSQVIG